MDMVFRTAPVSAAELVKLPLDMDQHVIHVQQEHFHLLTQPHAPPVAQALIPQSEHPHAPPVQQDNTLPVVLLPVLLVQLAHIQHLQEEHPAHLV